jgi:hypothetical protein
MKKIYLALVLLSTLTFSNDLINNYGIKADNTTLLGIDKNDNGIRDDVEEYFKHTYNQKTDKLYLNALSNIAIIDTSLFQASEFMDILKIDELLIKRKKAELCIEAIFTDSSSSSQRNYRNAIHNYERIFLNTKKRKLLLKEIKEHYNNEEILDLVDKETCASEILNIDNL